MAKAAAIEVEERKLRKSGWRQRTIDEAALAYDRADAWARSVKGTPYGSTTPTLTEAKR